MASNRERIRRRANELDFRKVQRNTLLALRDMHMNRKPKSLADKAYVIALNRALRHKKRIGDTR